MLESYVKFRRGLLSDFNNIAEKESDTLYFIYENESSLTADLYLGARKISSGISTGTGGASTLKELTDVLLSEEISPNSLLVYDDNGRWVNKTLNEIFSDVNLNQVIKVVKNNQKANSHQDLIDEAFATEEELPKNGDIVIIEDITSTGVIQHTTGYIYDGSHWVAMNGNYNADNIYFDNNFIFTEDIGTIVIPESGSYEAPAAGKNLTEFLASIFAQEKDPETTNPTAVISVTGGNGEVGSSYSLPKATLTVTDGAYNYGSKENNVVYDAENTGVTFQIGDIVLTETETNSVSNSEVLTNGSITLTAQKKINSETQEVLESIYADNEQTFTFSAEVVCTPSQTRVPVSNIGNPKIEKQIGYDVENQQIKNEMSIAVTGTNVAKFTGWRKMFMGTVNEYNALTGAKVPVTIDSTLIRSLNKISEKVNTSAKEFTVPVGATKIIIACPKTHELSKCEYFTMSWETISNFPQIDDVQVADARGADNGLTDYNIYVFEHASPSGFETDTKYRFTLKKA